MACWKIFHLLPLFHSELNLHFVVVWGFSSHVCLLDGMYPIDIPIIYSMTSLFFTVTWAISWFMAISSLFFGKKSWDYHLSGMNTNPAAQHPARYVVSHHYAIAFQIHHLPSAPFRMGHRVALREVTHVPSGAHGAGGSQGSRRMSRYGGSFPGKNMVKAT